MLKIVSTTSFLPSIASDKVVNTFFYSVKFGFTKLNARCKVAIGAVASCRDSPVAVVLNSVLVRAV